MSDLTVLGPMQFKFTFRCYSARTGARFPLTVKAKSLQDAVDVFYQQITKDALFVERVECDDLRQMARIYHNEVGRYV